MKKTLFFLRNLKRFGFSNARNLVNAHTKKSGELVVSFSDVKQPITLRYNTSDVDVFNQVFYHNYYSFNYTTYIKNINTIIDAGANIGMASVYFKNQFPNARIIAIEPESSNYNQLLKNISGYKNISTEHKGLWNKSCLLNVEDKYENGNWGFVVEEVNDASKSNVEGISVNDILIKYNLDRIDILKMDIEGAELEIFQENYEWLSKVKMLIIETHDFMRKGTSKALFKAMINYNFSVHTCRENIVFINDDLE